MDIARPDLARKKRTRRSLHGVGISVVVIRPGAAVTPDTIIVKLSNPELEQTAFETTLNLRAAEARYRSRAVELDSQILAQRAQLATLEAELAQAALQAEADEQLAEKG